MAKIPPAIAPMAGRAVGAAAPSVPLPVADCSEPDAEEVAEPAAELRLLRRELNSDWMEEEPAPSVALERAAEADDWAAEASLVTDPRAEETAEPALPVTEERAEPAPSVADERAEPAPSVADERADPAFEVTEAMSEAMPEVAEAIPEAMSEVMLFKAEVASPGRLVTSLATEERRESN